MKNALFFIVAASVVLSLLIACKQDESSKLSVVKLQTKLQTQADNSAVAEAFQRKKSDIFVQGAGVVKKLLPDDNKGARHQRFLASISPKQTLLFAHNIDLAARIDALSVGDTLEFRGEYVYNPKGGVVHWTHRDPKGEIEGGWIKHNGQTYQ